MTRRDLTDRELFERTREGDADCFGLFYRRRHRVVLAFLRPRVRDAELAADLMRETFAAALLAVHDRKRALPQQPLAWLLTIARHELLDAFRRGVVASNARRRLELEPVQLGKSEIEAVEDRAADVDLVAMLADELPSDQFEALCAYVLDGEPYPDIAAELGCSEAVVRKRVSRALKTLRLNREEVR